MNAPGPTVTDAPSEDDLRTIATSLAAFNEADVGPGNRTSLAVLERDEDGTLIAGISGFTAWGWLFVQLLWVHESARGQGLAVRMLEAAEHEARRRGCHGAWIDTFNPVALKVYTRAGYEPFGTLEDFPYGRTRTFLRKRL
jgi:GNAT superfamily N-acetyltransferase